MIRTILSSLIFLSYYVLSALILLPILFLLKKDAALAYARKNAKIWGKVLMIVTGSNIEIIYIDKENYETIRDDESFLLVANHQSNLDIPFLTGYFPRDLGFVAKKEMETWPLINIWMKKIKCVFLDRDNPRNAVKDIRQAIENIKEGHSMAIFPEGTRSKTGNIGEFQKGSIKIATVPKVKIIPVTIIGTGDIMGKKGRTIKGGQNLKLIIDKAIDTSELEKGELNNLHNEIRDIIVSNYNIYNRKKKDD